MSEVNINVSFAKCVFHQLLGLVARFHHFTSVAMRFAFLLYALRAG